MSIATHLSSRVWITYPLAHALAGGTKSSFIVSFPRSGSTWLRTMLVNLLKAEAMGNPKHFNRLIPGVTLTRLPLLWREKPMIRSTHALKSFRYKKVIYVLRDGRDSVMSFYRYTTTRNNREVSIDRWLQSYIKGFYGPRWDQHVRSWLDEAAIEGLLENLLIIRYEDMKLYPEKALLKACNFLDLQHTPEAINRAVNFSSIETMRRWERSEKGPIEEPNASFYRGGNNEWNKIMSPSAKEKFLLTTGDTLRLVGYLD